MPFLELCGVKVVDVEGESAGRAEEGKSSRG